MSDVLHRITKEFRRSVNDPDFPTAQWVLDPQIAGGPFRTGGVPTKYINIAGDVVTEMSVAEKAVVDAAEAAALTQSNRDVPIAETTEVTANGVEVRALIELLNKRDNFNTNRIIELQDTLTAMKAASGGAQNTRDAIPASFMATSTRTKAAAVTDYTDDIAAGNQDT